MQIRKRKTRKPRTKPVRYGQDSGGKRRLIGAVMQKGYSKRVGEKAVNAVIDALKRAAARHETVETPIGTMKVRKTPKNLLGKVHVSNQIGDRHFRLFRRWTTHNSPFQIWWKMPQDQWEALVRDIEVNLAARTRRSRRGEKPIAQNLVNDGGPAATAPEQSCQVVPGLPPLGSDRLLREFEAARLARSGILPPHILWTIFR